MELSDEQKRRILEEEEQRLAEEQYRAQVRRELQSQTGATGATGVAAAPAPAVMPPQQKPNARRNAPRFRGRIRCYCQRCWRDRTLSRAGPAEMSVYSWT